VLYWKKNSNDVCELSEAFTENETHTLNCPVLIDTINDKETYNRLSRKLKTINNNGDYFIGFRNKKPYNQDYNYCFVDTLDPTSSKDGVSCSKDNGIYDYSMVNSVDVGTIHEPGQKFPRDVCIMEIDKQKVDASDVIHMGDQIDRHDSSHLITSIDDYKNAVRRLVKQIDGLETTKKELTESLEQSNQKMLVCASEKKTLRIENVINRGHIDALSNNVSIIDINNYTMNSTLSLPNDEDETLVSYLSFNANSSMTEMNVPFDFNITHVFIPPNRTVRFIKKNGSFINFSANGANYPSTANNDVFNTVKVKLM
jgi:hypothetical protein